MKNNFALLLCLLLFVCKLSIAQDENPIMPIDSITHLITYTDVINVDSTSKDELYSRGREWFAKYYKSSNEVLQMQDMNSGKLIGKAIFYISAWTGIMTVDYGYITYSISLYFKDNKYKYVITNFYHRGEKRNGETVTTLGDCEALINKKTNFFGFASTYRSILKEINDNTTIIIEDLNKAMNIKSANNSNW